MTDQREQSGDNGRIPLSTLPASPALPPPPPPMYDLPQAADLSAMERVRENGVAAGLEQPEMEALTRRLAALTMELSTLTSRMDSLKTAPTIMEDSRPSSSATSRRASAYIPPTYEEYREGQWEKDLHRMAKLAINKKLSPLDEEELEDTLYEWEQISNGAGINNNVLIQLLLQLGSPAVTWAMSELAVKDLPWKEVKDKLARKLFPYSSYVRSLETEMMKEDRGKPLEGALIVLARQFERHGNLCRRWNRDNTFTGTRRKEALLQKVNADLIERCMCIKDFHTVPYSEFVDHCLMVDAAAVDAAVAKKLRAPKQLSEKMTGVTPAARAVAIAPTTTTPTPPAPAVMAVTPTTPSQPRTAPTCFNCGEKGHYQSGCPQPKARCATCGKIGHKAESCLRAQKEGPHGTTRTSTLRMTKRGVHFDLVDEATKRTFFDAMRKYIEQQDEQCQRAQERAKKKREDEKVVEMTDASTTRTLHDSSEVLGAVFMSVQPPGRVVATTNVSPEKQVNAIATDSHYLSMTILGIQVPALLDSGAVVSLLPAITWDTIPLDKRQGIPLCKPGAYPLMGIGGSFGVKSIVELPICVAEVHVLQRFFITEAVTTPILGMDALTCLGIRINFATGEICVEGRNAPIPPYPNLGIAPMCAALQTWNVDTRDGMKGEGCMDDELEQATQLFAKWESVWKDPIPGACTLTTHHIDTGEARPITNRVRRLSPEKLKELEVHIAELLASGAIRTSTSPWASPIVLVPKPSGQTRLCIDYRALNGVTVADKYPLPRITELLDRLGSAKIFSTFDLGSGFHQIPLSESSKSKTAFITPKGLYEYNVLPFGLVNAPGTFQRVIDQAFQAFPFPEAIGVYLDDIVVFTNDIAQHLQVMEEVFRTLHRARLFINLKKVKICSRRVKYLGFIICDGVISPDRQQIEAMEKLKPPKDVSGVRRFLGLAGYFRHFIPHFSHHALPLTSLLKKGVPFAWSGECHAAWENLKEALKGDQVRLSLPQPDQMFVLDTDASSTALGAVLMQEGDEKKLRPLAYASRTLSPAEQNWTTREQEAYAVVWGILHFAAYLRWQPHFIVRSDHQSLRWLWRSDNRRIIRWALLLQEYNFTLQHVKRENHAHVDIFSRDVKFDKEEEEEAARIEAKPRVFVIAEVDEDGEPAAFPSFDEVHQAQVEECQPERVEDLHLRKGNQGLWENAEGKVYVPEKMRKMIMYFYHFGRMGAHQGVNKAFRRIKRMFWWPSMRQDLQDYHATCLTCARRRPLPLVGQRGHLLAPHIGAIVAIDLIGPIKAREETVELLTITDHFTRYAHAVLLPKADSQSVWDALFSGWIAYFGAPIKLLSDNASIFKGKVFLQNAQEHHIQQIFAFPYHPQGNGVVEAFHIYFKRALVALLRQTTWSISRIISTILMVYRSTPHIATGETPFYLLTGMDMMLPGLQEWTPRSLPDEPGGRLDSLRQIRQDAFDKMARVAVEQQAKRKRKPFDATLLAPGSLVLHWLSPEERKKLSPEFGRSPAAPLWSGPCRILRKSEKHQDTYILQPIWEDTKAKAYHRERLIPVPRKWGAEELQAALMELVADLRRPPRKRSQRPTMPSMEGVPQHLQARTTAKLGEIQAALEDLPQDTTSASDLPIVDPRDPDSRDPEPRGLPIAHWSPGDEPWGRKRQRHVMCFSWKDVNAAFQIARGDRIYESQAPIDQSVLPPT